MILSLLSLPSLLMRSCHLLFVIHLSLLPAISVLSFTSRSSNPPLPSPLFMQPIHLLLGCPLLPAIPSSFTPIIPVPFLQSVLWLVFFFMQSIHLLGLPLFFFLQPPSNLSHPIFPIVHLPSLLVTSIPSITSLCCNSFSVIFIYATKSSSPRPSSLPNSISNTLLPSQSSPPHQCNR